MRKLLATTAILAALTMPSFAATFTIDHIIDSDAANPNPDAIVVVMDGDIENGDLERLTEALKKEREHSQAPVVAFELNSRGGEISTAKNLASMLAEYKIATGVRADKVCASACFLIFACGAERYASVSAHIGVHSARNANDQEDFGALIADTVMARQANACGVPDNIVGKIVVTPPESMYWLTAKDLVAMGVQHE
jgi:hypothetical protein